MAAVRTLHFAAGAFAALLLASSPVSIDAQDGSSKERSSAGDPVKVLSAARAALGGEDKLRLVKTLQVKGGFRRTIGSNQLEGDIEVLVALPDKMKRIEDMSLPGGGPAQVVTQALNGSDAWDDASGGAGGFFIGPGGGGGRRGGFGGGGFGGGGGRRSDGGQGGPADQAAGRGAADPERFREIRLRQRQEDLSRLVLAWLLTTDAPVKWVGKAESPDGSADVLEISPADRPATRLFLDATTHLPLMLTWQGVAPQFFIRGGPRGSGPGAPDQAAQPSGPGDQPAAQAGPDQSQGARRGRPPVQATLRMTLADYQAEGGIKLPRTITRGINGQTNEEWTGLRYKVNPSFKPNAFEQKK